MARFLLVTNIFPPQIGGPATFIERTARELAERGGHSVTVVCSSECPHDDSDRGRPYRVRRIHTASPLRYHLNLRRVLASEMLTHRRILVNGLETYVHSVARLLGRSYVLKIVGDVVWENARNVGRTCLDIDEFQRISAASSLFRDAVAARDAYVRAAVHVITPSEYLRKMVVGWGIAPARVTTIYNGIDSLTTAGVLPTERVTGPLKVTFVGRLTNWKGVETLLLAASMVEDIEVTIAGDGPAMPQLVELAAQLRLQRRVTFTGRQSRRAVQELMARSHVLVLTSLYEGLSHTLLEAMAVGLPCIASDRGGNGEVIANADTGLLVPAQNVEALRVALMRLRNDENYRRRLASAAKAGAASFGIERTVRAVTDLLMHEAW